MLPAAHDEVARERRAGLEQHDVAGHRSVERRLEVPAGRNADRPCQGGARAHGHQTEREENSELRLPHLSVLLAARIHLDRDSPGNAVDALGCRGVAGRLSQTHRHPSRAPRRPGNGAGSRTARRPAKQSARRVTIQLISAHDRRSLGNRAFPEYSSAIRMGFDRARAATGNERLSYSAAGVTTAARWLVGSPACGIDLGEMNSNDGLPLVAPGVTPCSIRRSGPLYWRRERSGPWWRGANAPCPCGSPSSRPTARSSASTSRCCPTHHERGQRERAISRAVRQVPAVVARRVAHPRRWSGRARRGRWPPTIADTPTGRFDADLVGERMFDHPLEVVHTSELPAERCGDEAARAPPRGLPHRLRPRRQRSQGGGGRRRRRWSSARRPSGTRTTSRIRSTTSTASWTRCRRPPRTCRAWTPSAEAPRAST